MEDGRQFCEKYKCFVFTSFEIGFKKTLERGKYMKNGERCYKTGWQKTKLLAETLEVPCTDTDVCPGNDFFLCI